MSVIKFERQPKPTLAVIAQVSDRAALQRMFDAGIVAVIVRDEEEIVATYSDLYSAAYARELDDYHCRALDLDVMLHPEQYD